MIRKSYRLLSLLQAVLSQEWKVDTPREVTAQEGLCAKIPCHYSYPSRLANDSRVGVWFNNGEQTPWAPLAFHSKDHNQESPRFRHQTRLSGELKDGDCSLIINNITQQDAGSYFFRIELDNSDQFNYYPATWLHVSAAPSQEWKGGSPREVTAQEGLCAKIPCHYSYPSCLANDSRGGVWFNNEERIRSSIAFHSKDHNHESPLFRHRTRLSGELKDGDCSLIINNITQRDAGPYYFRIEFDNWAVFNYYPVTRLHVSAAPSQEWKCVTPREVTAQEGLCAKIPCHYSYPSCLANRPQAGVWFNNEEWITSSTAFHSKDHNHESPLFRHRTRLSGELKDGDCSLIMNNITKRDAGPYYFRIEFDNGDQFSYYPATWLHVSDFTDKPMIFPAEIIAGKRVDVSCTFNTICNGTAPVLTWVNHTDVGGSVSNSVTQHGITLTYTSVLTLIPSPKHHGQTLTCRVSYPSVSSEQTLTLTVQYKPEISRESDCARKAEGVTCVCAARANPPGDLTWHLPLANVSGNQTHGRFVAWRVSDGQLVTGSLTLREGEGEEEATVFCSVRNRHGEAMFKVYLWVKAGDSNEWKVGLLAAGITLSVALAGFLIFNCVQKRKAATEERASEPSDIAMTSSPLSTQHQGTQSGVVTDLWNATSDATSEAETPAPQDLSEGPAGGDAGHGQPAKHEDLLYSNINFLKLPSGDRTVDRGEGTEYAEIRFQ